MYCFISMLLRLVLVITEGGPYFIIPYGCPTSKLVWEVDFDVHCCWCVPLNAFMYVLDDCDILLLIYFRMSVYEYPDIVWLSFWSAIHMLMINAPKLREAESAIIVSDDSFMEVCYLPSPTMEILYCCVLSGLPSSVSVVFILWCYTHMPRLRINLISRLQCVILTTLPERSLLYTQCL